MQAGACQLVPLALIPLTPGLDPVSALCLRGRRLSEGQVRTCSAVPPRATKPAFPGWVSPAGLVEARLLASPLDTF